MKLYCTLEESTCASMQRANAPLGLCGNLEPVSGMCAVDMHLHAGNTSVFVYSYPWLPPSERALSVLLPQAHATATIVHVETTPVITGDESLWKALQRHGDRRQDSLVSSGSNISRSEKHGVDWWNRRVGVFLLFLSSILLLVTTISAPVINHLSLLHVTLRNGTTAEPSRLSFGTLGYCVLNAQTPK